MNPRMRLACLVADAAHWGITRLTRKGGGNIPGALALRIDPDLIGSLAGGLGSSVVLTGTNGKTTTTGLVADVLEAAGRAVVCNRAGNNMSSGVAAAMVAGRMSGSHGASGGGAHIRIGCFECDELYTREVLPQLRPRALVLLNLFRDQLDRYGEIDHTQDVIAQALASSPSTTLVYNADDPLCAAIALRVDNPKLAFGIDEYTGAEPDRVSDSRFCARCNAALDYEYVHYGQLGAYRCPACGWERPALDFAARNLAHDGHGWSFDVEDRRRRGQGPSVHHVESRHAGLYMVYNVMAALAASLVMGAGDVDFQKVLDAYRPAGARGEEFPFGRVSAVADLAKNPTGFDRMIQVIRAEDTHLMAFFLNDNDADGHDISWIWDVDFERLADLTEIWHVFVGGTRAEELAVRLKYSGVGAPISVVQGMRDVLAQSCAVLDEAGKKPGSAGIAPNPNGEKVHVVANYTAFPPVVAELARLSEEGWEAPGPDGGPHGRAGAGKAQGAGAAEAAFKPLGNEKAPAAPALALERPLRIVHLYPDALNLYGDGGNIASLYRRCSWRGIPAQVDQVLMGSVPDLADADVVLLGGGADRDQLAVCEELLRRREAIARYVEDGGMLLAICGGYQLLGAFYEMDGRRIEGLGVLDVETVSGSPRLIGNMAVDSPVCAAPIVGFENHAGRTTLGPGETPLGRTLVPGTGNNGTDGGEGILHGGVIGTYLHGPILPKNPGVTDWLIAGALRRRGLADDLAPLDDDAERAAHAVALRIARREKPAR